jgi:hypothetical protein
MPFLRRLYQAPAEGQRVLVLSACCNVYAGLVPLGLFESNEIDTERWPSQSVSDFCLRDFLFSRSLVRIINFELFIFSHN